MKLSKRDIQMLLGVIGVAAAALVYFMYFKPTQEDTQRIKSENQQLEARIAELESLEAQREFFLEEIDKNEEKVAEIYDQFPGGLLPEDIVQDTIDMQDASQVLVESFNMSEPVSIYTPIGCKLADMSAAPANNAAQDTAEGEEAAPAAEESAETGYDALQEKVSYTFSCDLNQFENAIEHVNDRNNRDVIDTVSLVYNSEEGILSCLMNMSKYYVTGRDDVEYTPAEFNVPTGMSSLFTTISGGAGASSAPAGDEAE